MDVQNLEKAFSFLADTDAGKVALEKLRNSLNELQKSISPDLNRAEFLYVAQKLISQLPIAKKGMDDGLLFAEAPGGVTRLTAGPGSDKITPSGFVIKSSINEDGQQ